VRSVRRGKLNVVRSTFGDRRRKYDWSKVRAHYDAGHPFRVTMEHFGFSSASWFKAVQRGEITPRVLGMPIAELLASPKRNRTHLKLRLIKARLLENRCQTCGLRDWLGKPLNMHLDHVNGVRNDNRLENLRMLCPNCHAQTPTYSGRNTKLRRLQEPLRVM
jgi:hypothetical protein